MSDPRCPYCGRKLATQPSAERAEGRIAVLETERDQLAQEVMRHEHGSLVAKKYRAERDAAVALLRSVKVVGYLSGEWYERVRVFLDGVSP